MNKKAWRRPAVVAAYVLAVTFMAGKWAICSAYRMRGYFAIGGEYLFIPMVALVSYVVIKVFLNALEERGRKSKKEGTASNMEKEHSVKDQSAQMDNHIVTVPTVQIK